MSAGPGPKPSARARVSSLRALPFALGLALALAERSPAHADAPVPLRGDRLTTLPDRGAPPTAYGAYLLRAPVPAQPFAPAVPLRGATSTTTAALALADGTIAVGASGRGNALLRVDTSGALLSSTALPSMPAGELVQGADGRVFVWSDNARALYAVAPDGTLRGASQVGLPSPAPPVVRADGSIVLAVAQPSPGTGQVLSLSPEGELLGTRSVRGPVRGLAGDAGPCVWALLGGGVACVRGDGSVAEPAFGGGAIALAPLGGGLIATLGSAAVQVHSRRGELLAELDVGQNARMIRALPGGGLAVVRDGPPTEIMLVARDGTVVARAPVPGNLVALLADESGALLAVSQEGGLTALEADGTPRWALDLGQRVSHASPAPGGGVLVTFESSGALSLLR